MNLSAHPKHEARSNPPTTVSLIHSHQCLLYAQVWLDKLLSSREKPKGQNNKKPKMSQA
jgi:hypothetical protein